MFGDVIKNLRLSYNLSQVQLANKLSVSKQTVSNWENNNILPSIEMSYKFYGWEQATVLAATEAYPDIHTPRDLYDALSELWCEATCAPRLREVHFAKEEKRKRYERLREALRNR